MNDSLDHWGFLGTVWYIAVSIAILVGMTIQFVLALLWPYLLGGLALTAAILLAKKYM